MRRVRMQSEGRRRETPGRGGGEGEISLSPCVTNYTWLLWFYSLRYYNTTSKIVFFQKIFSNFSFFILPLWSRSSLLSSGQHQLATHIQHNLIMLSSLHVSENILTTSPTNNVYKTIAEYIEEGHEPFAKSCNRGNTLASCHYRFIQFSFYALQNAKWFFANNTKFTVSMCLFRCQ